MSDTTQVKGDQKHEADATRRSRDRLFQLLGVVVPISTFILGYGLSSWDRYSDKRNELDNLRYILGVELSQNLRRLASVQPPADYQRPAPPQLVSILASALSVRVFDAYLAKLATLRPAEAKSIFDAYQATELLKTEAREFLEIPSPPESDRSLWSARATALLSASAGAFEKTGAAVTELPVPSSTVAEALKERGEAIRNYHEIETMLMHQNNE